MHVKFVGKSLKQVNIGIATDVFTLVCHCNEINSI